ncbi:DUF1080 domain-containing protein [Sphingobacterium sp. HMA12]|uniref:3-keto-disaccharide hydrolase n=1 Tax=Sphingobacterium sp. HMA12 TaxID=2050894 RepID=UPI000CEA0078|nr:DUF1080 domain-containing protein [Sphingobacterium sp. HMA12]
MKNFKNLLFSCISMSAMLISCDQEISQPNTLSEKEKTEGWQLLFDGKSLDKWHVYNQTGTNPAWVIKDGILYCDPNNQSNRGDLVSNETYQNYEFQFDWKLEKEGNSGVFINVQEKPDINATWQSGPEYQLLEDSHADFSIPQKKAGCLYTFLPQQNFVNTKTKAEWNTSRIIQKDGKVTFVLNNKITAEMDFNSDKWKSMVQQSHFKDFPEFGKNTSGKIALQDWSRGVSFRNLKIKAL